MRSENKIGFVALFLFFILLAVTGCVVKPPSYASGFCNSDEDCVPASCCHATDCVSKDQAPDCTDVFCTMECRPGTLDCGGRCVCEDNKCVAKFAKVPMEPIV